MEKVLDGCQSFEVKRVEHLKRALRKNDVDSIPEDIQSEIVCKNSGEVVYHVPDLLIIEDHMRIDSLMPVI